MNNLSLILKTYFVDADFDKIIGSFVSLKKSEKFGMNEEDFARHFLKREDAYGYDVVKTINQHAMDCWIKDDSGNRGVFNICAKAAKNMLI